MVMETTTVAGPGRVTATAWPRILVATGAVLLVTMLVHLAVLVVTGGPVTGPVSLRKPATFAETGWLVAWSVALLMPVLRMRAWQEHLVGASAALFGLAETAIMAVQAWRGVPSHYNFSTPFDAALVRGGAAGTAGIFLVGVVVLLVVTARAQIPSDVRLGVLGGGAVLLVGCAVGLLMISANSGVHDGTAGSAFADRTAAYLGPDLATVGPDYLLVRPATRGGDLVLPHAIGVHGLVLLAVPAVLLARTGVPAARRWLITATAVIAVGVAMAVLLGHALRALPLIDLHPVLIGVLGLCAVALAGSWAAVVVALVRRRKEELHRADQPQHHPLPR